MMTRHDPAMDRLDDWLTTEPEPYDYDETVTFETCRSTLADM